MGPRDRCAEPTLRATGYGGGNACRHARGAPQQPRDVGHDGATHRAERRQVQPARVNAAGMEARELKDADAIVAEVIPLLRSGDVVAILSNGGFGGIYEKLPQRLRALREVPART